MSATEDTVLTPQPSTATGTVLLVTRSAPIAPPTDSDVDAMAPPPPPPPQFEGDVPQPPSVRGAPPPPVPDAKPTPSAPSAPLTKLQNSYVSSAFKSGLQPGMFVLPATSSLSADKLADLCDQFNYVAKDAGDLRDKVLSAVKLTSGTTGKFDVNQLEAKLKEFWTTLHALRREQGDEGTTQSPDPLALPPIPSAAAIRDSARNWKKGSGVDPIKQHRPRAIANVKMDPDDPKKVVVDTRALDGANRALEAQGSFIRLQPVGKPDKDGFVKIRPVWDVAKAVTAKHDEAHTKLLDINRERQSKTGAEAEVVEEEQYVSWADCHRTAQTIMGSEEHNSGIGDTERVRMKGVAELVAPVPKAQISQIPLATDHGANRAMHGMFAKAMPSLRARLEKENPDKDSTRGKLLAQIKAAEAERASAPDERVGKAPPNFRDVYRMIYKDDDLRREFETSFGINGAIVPKVGAAFAQINDEQEKKQSDRDLWNFHFAGVVLVNEDGSYMTMENLSVEDATAVNDDWYFAVYDPKQGKSFHEVNAKDSHVGEYPLTMLFEKMPRG